MDFTVPRNELAIAVTHAAHGIPANPFHHVRAGMNILTGNETVLFSGSDGDVTFSGRADNANVTEEGNITVPGRLLADVVKTLPDREVRFTSDRVNCVLACGRVNFKFPLIRDEYPDLPVRASAIGTLDEGVFTEMVRKVLPASAKGDTNPSLATVYIESDGDTLWAVSTDKFRLAAVESGWKHDGDIKGLKGALIPAWAADRFTKGAEGPVAIGWDENVVTLRAGNLAVISRVMQGTFPKWRKLIPDEDCTVTVNANALRGALQRAQLASGEQHASAELTFDSGKLHVTAGSDNYADDLMDAEHHGEPFKALFGISMLVDGLAGCDDTAWFGWSPPHVWIQSGTYTYAFTPRRKQ